MRCEFEDNDNPSHDSLCPYQELAAQCSLSGAVTNPCLLPNWPEHPVESFLPFGGTAPLAEEDSDDDVPRYRSLGCEQVPCQASLLQHAERPNYRSIGAVEPSCCLSLHAMDYRSLSSIATRAGYAEDELDKQQKQNHTYLSICRAHTSRSHSPLAEEYTQLPPVELQTECPAPVSPVPGSTSPASSTKRPLNAVQGSGERPELGDRPKIRRDSDEHCSPRSTSPGSPTPTRSFEFLLEVEEIFDAVLSHLPAPDLFRAMAVSRTWRGMADANYAQRLVTVPASNGMLLRAVASAHAGETLILSDGIHWLDGELNLNKPLKLQAEAGAQPVIASSGTSLVRISANAWLEGLLLCRMSSRGAHPNSVVVVQSDVATILNCRITSGTAAASLEEAIQVFDDAPAAGKVWPEEAATHLASRLEAAGERQGAPQAGIWVGSMARVDLRASTIACTDGPGVKVYRGELRALGNTIGFSRTGANVVANGGKVLLQHTQVLGARGDGIALWNSASLQAEDNSIHSNAGSGITINNGNGTVNVHRNWFAHNGMAAVFFATSFMNKASLTDNDVALNLRGGISGFYSKYTGSLSASSGSGTAPTASVSAHSVDASSTEASSWDFPSQSKSTSTEAMGQDYHAPPMPFPVVPRRGISVGPRSAQPPVGLPLKRS